MENDGNTFTRPSLEANIYFPSSCVNYLNISTSILTLLDIRIHGRKFVRKSHHVCNDFMSHCFLAAAPASPLTRFSKRVIHHRVNVSTFRMNIKISKLQKYVHNKTV